MYNIHDLYINEAQTHQNYVLLNPLSTTRRLTMLKKIMEKLTI